VGYRPPSYIIDLGIFLAATGATYFAQSIDRPITAVLVYLCGVILIAVHSGLLIALAGAIAASLVYNFFLSEPVFEFGVTTVDETVPLLAFNATALLTGILVGRLKDTALRAHRASSDAAFLLTISDRLQSALEVSDVENALRDLLPTQGVKSVKIFLSKGEIYIRPSTGEIKSDRLDPLLEDVGTDRSGKSVVLELIGARGALGIAKFEFTDDLESRPKIPDLQSITSLLALAVERCLLLEQLAERHAQTRSEALKDSLLSSVSHDLRTPITVIEAAAGALISSQINLPDAEKEQLLETVIEQCHRLDRYTSELLDVGRIQAGFETTAMQPTDMRDVANLAIRQLQATHPDIAIDRKFESSPAIILGNAALLEQAIFNILHNAAKFGGAAPIAVATSSKDGIVALTISDNGPGVPSAEQSRIFERFYKSNLERREGTGLGLYIAKGFVTACGGVIGIVSPIENNSGTSFILEFPLVPTDVPEQAEVSA